MWLTGHLRHSTMTKAFRYSLRKARDTTSPVIKHAMRPSWLLPPLQTAYVLSLLQKRSGGSFVLLDVRSERRRCTEAVACDQTACVSCDCRNQPCHETKQRGSVVAWHQYKSTEHVGLLHTTSHRWRSNNKSSHAMGGSYNPAHRPRRL